ncbi:hypothetical protein Sp14A_06040 [Streptococcus pluranimalium]|uniref:Uncharacterized protein n=1 Tax=Streptococcus pluranimalium TaxID=82348 RepID=A0A345VII2_9STRE|nr:hypothetical protein Sp14A_05640 [Streptococcus pluranimalium]AXJ12534.1 hypothetical protein Sp14A_06040 [Streptococcus pluranimalium]
MDKKEAEKYMMKLIDTKSKIKSWYINLGRGVGK